MVACVLIAAALPFLVLPIDDMLVDGLFTWHLEQPQTVEGGLEALALFSIVAALLLGAARWPLLLPLVAIPVGLYLRRHHVDVPVLAAWLYFEALVAGGAAIERALRLPLRKQDALGDLRCFLTGLSAWCLTALAVSAVGFGSPTDLRVTAVVFGVLVLAVARRPPLVLRFARWIPTRGAFERIGAGFLVALAGVLMARTNVTHYHDSLWYGLRGEYVLAADGSFFTSLGLVNQVHYYPKLFEVLYLPLSGLGDFSFVLAVNVAAWAFLVLTVHRLARELGVEPGAALLAAIVATTLPAVANIPLTSKPDLFAALLLTMSALFFWRFLAQGSIHEAGYGIAGVALACATKVTSIPYGGLLVIAVAGAAWQRRGDLHWPQPRLGWAAALTASAAGAAFAGFTLRTYLLAGVPTIVPSQLVRVWELLGFSLRDPVATIVRHRSKDLTQVPSIAWDFLFAPTELPLVAITWTGNSWAYLGLATLLLLPLTPGWRGSARRPTWIFAPVLVAGLFFALLFNNTQRGGDGNYYMFPLLLATLLTFAAAAGRAGALRPLLFSLLVPFVALHVLVGFLTAAWAPGTKTFDLDLGRSVFDTREVRAQKLARRGLTEIAEALEEQPGVARVVGVGDEDLMRWLPARYESLSVISNAQGDPTETPAAFARYVTTHGIDFIIMPRAGTGRNLAAVEALLTAADVPVIVNSPLFSLYDLRPVHDELSEVAAGLELPRLHRHVDLVAALGSATLEGQRPITAPWRYAIAVADRPIHRYTGRPTMIQLHDSAVTWEIELPQRKGLTLLSRVGLLPEFEVANVSDGAQFELRVEAVSGEVRQVVHDIAPGSGYPAVELSLEGLEGQRVRVRSEVRPGLTNHQDWLIWIGPRIVSPAEPVQSEAKSGTGHRPAPARSAPDG